MGGRQVGTLEDNTVFPLTIIPGIYLILKLSVAALIEGRRLKEEYVYFKISVVHVKFQDFVVVSFQISTNTYHYDIKFDVLD